MKKMEVNLGLKKALNMQPEEIVDLVKESGLKGKRGSRFSYGLKMEFYGKKYKKSQLFNLQR